MEKFLGGLVIVVVASLLLSLVYGWVFMLLLGVLHENVSDAIPAIGYWASIVPAFLIRLLVADSSTD